MAFNNLLLIELLRTAKGREKTMKLYTLTYNDARPTKQQVNIPTNSDYKIGIKVIGSKDAGKVVKS